MLGSMRLRHLVLAATAVFVLASAPAGPSFHLRFDDEFTTAVKLGSFSGCDHATDTPQAVCTGLAGRTRADWWAYPDSWPDTATQRDYPVGGYYDPEHTVWISGGEMHIRQYRPASGGPSHVATVVPKPAMGVVYGRFEVRERVSTVGIGFKTADLRWPVDNGTCAEVDFPESEHDTHPSAFYHPAGCGPQLSFPTAYKWTTWHTYDIESTPAGTSFRVDGKEIGHTSQHVSVPQDWDIQNESALNGKSARPGTVDQVDIAYVKVWSWS